MSLASLLSIARTALLTHQRAMDVTAHNIANANTPGYTRQKLLLTPETPQWGPLFSTGRGVTAAGIQRTRDSFYDSTFRTDSGTMGRAGTTYEYLGRIEATMGEPSTTGLASALDGVFRAFADLAGDPASGPNRELVRSAAGRVTQQLRSMSSTIGDVRQDALEDMRVQVDQVNQLSQQIGRLNGRILASGGPTHTAADLMDQRDLLIDQLAQLVDVRVLPRADGTVGVQGGGQMLVDGEQVALLAVTTVGAGFGLVTQSGGNPVDARSGSLHALAQLTQTDLPAVQAQLDQLAQSLVTEFNALHRAGYTLNGATNVDFFDPAGVTASTISLSAAVRGSADNIAAASVNAPGDGGVAAALAALATTGVVSLGGRTLREHYVGLAAGLGLDVQSAKQDFEAQLVLVEQADQARQSVGGVSIDEEMVGLIGQQQAYQAAARLISVADEMMQDIMRIL